MPCYTVNLISLEIQAADRDLLEKVLKKKGLSYNRIRNDIFIQVDTNAYDGGSIIIQGDRAKLPGRLQGELNLIKQAYAREVVETAAEQFQWTVSEEEDELVLRRYSYES